MVTDVWRELWSYLKTEVATTVDTSLGTEKPVVMNFRVTNTSPSSADRPEIIFKDVKLKVGKVPSVETKNLGTLTSGQSAAFEYRCSFEDSLDVRHEVTATISPEDVFRVRLGPGHPNLGQQFPLAAYLQMYRQANVHRWLNSTIKAFPAPGPDTTLAQLEAHRRSINQAFKEIDEVLVRLSTASGLVTVQHRDQVTNHWKALETYSTSLKSALSELSRALSEPRSVGDVLKHSIERLERLAAELEKATAALSSQAK